MKVHKLRDGCRLTITQVPLRSRSVFDGGAAMMKVM